MPKDNLFGKLGFFIEDNWITKRKEVTAQNRLIFFFGTARKSVFRTVRYSNSNFINGEAILDSVNLREGKIFTVARDLYERTGRVEGHDLDNWLEAERIVRTLKKIAGEGCKKIILINVPVAQDSLKEKKRIRLLCPIGRSE